MEKAREFQKNIYFCFIDYAKALDCVDHNKLWKILKEMGIPDHLTCLLRNLYAGPEVTVRTGHGTTDWFQIGKGVRQGCILSPCLFNICREHHVKCQAEWITSWNQDCWEIHRYTEMLRYTWYHFNVRKWRGTKEPLDDGEKEEWKAGWKLSIQKRKIMASSPITSKQIDGETMEIRRVTIYSLDVLLFLFGTSLLFHVQF